MIECMAARVVSGGLEGCGRPTTNCSKQPLLLSKRLNMPVYTVVLYISRL